MQAVLLYGAAAVLFGGASFVAYKRFRPLPQAQGADIKKVQDLIDGTKVLVLSKSYCPYCIKTKQLLSELKAVFTAIELDELPNGDELQSAAYVVWPTSCALRTGN